MRSEQCSPSTQLYYSVRIERHAHQSEPSYKYIDWDISMLLSPSISWLLPTASASTLGFLNLSPAMLWLVAGVLLCLVEVVVPTAFTTFMMGVSALVVALVALLLPKQLALQVFLWIAFSTVFVYLSHRLMPKRKVSALEDATEAQTLTEILPGQTGRVLYEGNSWRARCGDEKQAIALGQKVYVIGRQGTTLIVMPEHLFMGSG